MQPGRLLSELSSIAKKKYQRLRKREEGSNPITHKEFIIQHSPLIRRKGSKRGKLTVADKISIAHQAIVQHELQSDIAKCFRTSKSRVCQIVQQVLRRKGAIEEIVAHRDSTEQ